VRDIISFYWLNAARAGLQRPLRLRHWSRDGAALVHGICRPRPWGSGRRRRHRFTVDDVGQSACPSRASAIRVSTSVQKLDSAAWRTHTSRSWWRRRKSDRTALVPSTGAQNPYGYMREVATRLKEIAGQSVVVTVETRTFDIARTTIWNYTAGPISNGSSTQWRFASRLEVRATARTELPLSSWGHRSRFLRPVPDVAGASLSPVRQNGLGPRSPRS
jgi:hypothetical protein